MISGLGADFKSFRKIAVSRKLGSRFYRLAHSRKDETFSHYVERMAEKIDVSEPFYLLGYSFGGILVQEIDKIKPAEKVVILGSIKSDKEKSRFIKIGEFTKIPKVLPEEFLMKNPQLLIH